jgi:hypothetical protein
VAKAALRGLASRFKRLYIMKLLVHHKPADLSQVWSMRVWQSAWDGGWRVAQVSLLRPGFLRRPGSDSGRGCAACSPTA